MKKNLNTFDWDDLILKYATKQYDFDSYFTIIMENVWKIFNNMNPGRTSKLNRAVVSDYFEKLQTVLTNLDVQNKPQFIYNMDEKGCRLALHQIGST